MKRIIEYFIIVMGGFAMGGYSTLFYMGMAFNSELTWDRFVDSMVINFTDFGVEGLVWLFFGYTQALPAIISEKLLEMVNLGTFSTVILLSSVLCGLFLKVALVLIRLVLKSRQN